jgi:hypothetical protein
MERYGQLRWLRGRSTYLNAVILYFIGISIHLTENHMLKKWDIDVNDWSDLYLNRSKESPSDYLFMECLKIHRILHAFFLIGAKKCGELFENSINPINNCKIQNLHSGTNTNYIANQFHFFQSLRKVYQLMQSTGFLNSWFISKSSIIFTEGAIDQVLTYFFPKSFHDYLKWTQNQKKHRHLKKNKHISPELSELLLFLKKKDPLTLYPVIKDLVRCLLPTFLPRSKSQIFIILEVIRIVLGSKLSRNLQIYFPTGIRITRKMSFLIRVMATAFANPNLIDHDFVFKKEWITAQKIYSSLV